MRLSEFILTHRERILSEWTVFARSCLPSAGTMDIAMLRDHASEMLETIAADLTTPQSEPAEVDKSRGKLDSASGAPYTAAQMHGAARAASGFAIEQMVSEYRALRASVTRLWIETSGGLALVDLSDLIRFNEAIDQSLAESTSSYTQDLDRSKELFLAMLGHDLRAPLGAIMGAASAQVLEKTKERRQKLLQMNSIILNSGQRMDALIGDLLDFTLSRLGGGIPVVRTEMDIADVCQQTVAEVTALYPQRVVNLEATGELQGQWDKERVSQVLSNVISNAVQHGSDRTPINIAIRGEADQVGLTIQNWGPVIPTNQLQKIFDPMHRIEDARTASHGNLGLGLYITERIVAAHGGTIGIESSEENGTTFTIRLPKRDRTERSPGLIESA